jgi:hypothetical protein
LELVCCWFGADVRCRVLYRAADMGYVRALN